MGEQRTLINKFMNLNRTKCPICSNDITNNNIVRHSVACSRPKIEKIKGFNPRNTGMKGRNQFSKARDEGREIPKHTAETKAKGLATKQKNGSLKHTEESKRKLSAIMKLAVKNNPESYSSANRGRTKQIIVDGIKLQGQWEVDFYNWAKGAGLNPVRPSKSFKYDWNGIRSYFPDFYIESIGYVEVKGYETSRDRAKWTQFPELLFVVREQAIKDIRNNAFTVDQLSKLLYNTLS
jgi:hypothetical protein